MNDFQFRINMRLLDIIERSLLAKGASAVNDGFTQIEPTVEEMVEKPSFISKSIDLELEKAMDNIIKAEE